MTEEIKPLPYWSFRKDKNLRSFIKMMELHYDEEGNIWKRRCGLNCNCYILLQASEKRSDNNYSLRVFKHTNVALVNSTFLARFWEIPHLFEQEPFERKNDLREGQIWHIIDRQIKVDDIFILDYINTQALRLKVLDEQGKDHIYLSYSIEEFKSNNLMLLKRLLANYG